MNFLKFLSILNFYNLFKFLSMNRPSGTTLKNRCIITSVGVEALDALLDGGAANTSIIVLEEVHTSKFSSPICRCFLAEGLESGHSLFIATSVENQIKNFMNNLPKLTTKKLNMERKDDSKNDENMKIAWRYNTVSKVDSFIGGQQQNHKFDLSQKQDINLEELQKENRYYWYALIRF